MHRVTDQSFLEVKLKAKKDRTVKRRIATDTLVTACTPELADFIGAQGAAQGLALEPKLWNEFTRITLVSGARAERLTVDLDLAFAGAARPSACRGWPSPRLSRPGPAAA